MRAIRISFLVCLRRLNIGLLSFIGTTAFPPEGAQIPRKSGGTLD